MVDYGRMPPDAMMAQKFGVTEHFVEAYPEPVANGNTNGHVADAGNRSGLFN
jgi:hypothetical protein